MFLVISLTRALILKYLLTSGNLGGPGVGGYVGPKGDQGQDGFPGPPGQKGETCKKNPP